MAPKQVLSKNHAFRSHANPSRRPPSPAPKPTASDPTNVTHNIVEIVYPRLALPKRVLRRNLAELSQGRLLACADILLFNRFYRRVSGYGKSCLIQFSHIRKYIGRHIFGRCGASFLQGSQIRHDRPTVLHWYLRRITGHLSYSVGDGVE